MGLYMLPQKTLSGTPFSCQWKANWSSLTWSSMKLPPTKARYDSSAVPNARSRRNAPKPGKTAERRFGFVAGTAGSMMRLSGTPMPLDRSLPPSFHICISWPAKSGSDFANSVPRMPGNGELPGRVSPSQISVRMPQRGSIGVINCM